MKILLTAFDPFGGEAINPAREVAAALPDQIGGADIIKLWLPTVFGEAGEKVTKAMDDLRPDAVISLGQAGGRKAVTPERIAINLMDARSPDNAGNQPQEQVIEQNGPDGCYSTLPVKAMAAAIREQGLPGEVSLSAGAFVCNDVMYRALRHAAKTMPSTRCGFIHVPYLPEQTAEKPDVPSLSLADMVRALIAALQVVAEDLAAEKAK